MSRVFRVDGFDIDTIANFTVRAINVTGFPDISSKSNKASSSDGGGQTGVYYSNRPIVVSGEIAGTDFDGMNDTLRTIWSYINGANKTIQVVINGSNVEYTATAENIKTGEATGGYLPIDIVFNAVDPIGVSDGYYTNTTSAFTTSPKVIAITPGGNYFAKPIITVTINSLTVTNPQTITLTSDSGALSITRTWTAGETLVVDTEARTVTVDGVAVLYSGSLPTLAHTATSLTYSDGFDARNVGVVIKHKKRYL